jgi:hypothetical protein
MESPEATDRARIEAILEPDELIEVEARATNALIAITDRRMAVASGGRIALDITYDRLRRIQFDIERARPAAFVVVPEHPSDDPQVLAVPEDEYEAVGTMLAVVGRRLAARRDGRLD